MRIRRCSACAQLVHFRPACPSPSCWNCGVRCNFARPNALHRALWLLPELPLLSQASGLARLALVAAMPIAALMLLMCNSFDIHIVHDFGSALAWPPPASTSLGTGCFGP